MCRCGRESDLIEVQTWSKKGTIGMWKYTVQVDGMMCGMCEAHVNDAVRKACPIKKVTSSHKKGETTIIVEEALDEQVLQEAIHATGYEVRGIQKELYQKHGLFG